MLACMIECEWYVKAQKHFVLYLFGCFSLFFVVLSDYLYSYLLPQAILALLFVFHQLIRFFDKVNFRYTLFSQKRTDFFKQLSWNHCLKVGTLFFA